MKDNWLYFKTGHWLVFRHSSGYKFYDICEVIRVETSKEFVKYVNSEDRIVFKAALKFSDDYELDLTFDTFEEHSEFLDNLMISSGFMDYSHVKIQGG